MKKLEEQLKQKLRKQIDPLKLWRKFKIPFKPITFVWTGNNLIDFKN